MSPDGIGDDEFYELCQVNSLYRLERNTDGSVTLRPSPGCEASWRTAGVTAQIGNWAKSVARGHCVGADSEFFLPDGSARQPDAAWVSDESLSRFTQEEKRGFLRLCPEFVIEVRPYCDRLDDLKRKMEEWIANGAELGWLIDPDARKAWIYRP
ncbi:MAG: Uma2 family endonuclease [Bryobacteraceae bacterium]|nr:Uma2 family endonuclease [Bryobacteraceae bacterium]